MANRKLTLAGTVALIATSILLFQLVTSEEPQVDEVLVESIASHFIDSSLLHWEGAITVNDTPHRKAWRAWSKGMGQMLEITRTGDVVTYLDFSSLGKRYVTDPTNMSSPLDEKALVEACYRSNLLPKDCQWRLVYSFYDRGINSVTFKQSLLGRMVEFNFVNMYVDGKGDICGFHIERTPLDPGKLKVSISESEAIQLCSATLKLGGHLSDPELVYVQANDQYGSTQSDSIHLAYSLKYTPNTLEPEYYGVVWVDAATGLILGGHTSG